MAPGGDRSQGRLGVKLTSLLISLTSRIFMRVTTLFAGRLPRRRASSCWGFEGHCALPRSELEKLPSLNLPPACRAVKNSFFGDKAGQTSEFPPPGARCFRVETRERIKDGGLRKSMLVSAAVHQLRHCRRCDGQFHLGVVEVGLQGVELP